MVHDEAHTALFDDLQTLIRENMIRARLIRDLRRNQVLRDIDSGWLFMHDLRLMVQAADELSALEEEDAMIQEVRSRHDCS